MISFINPDQTKKIDKFLKNDFDLINNFFKEKSSKKYNNQFEENLGKLKENISDSETFKLNIYDEIEKHENLSQNDKAELCQIVRLYLESSKEKSGDKVEDQKFAADQQKQLIILKNVIEKKIGSKEILGEVESLKDESVELEQTVDTLQSEIFVAEHFKTKINELQEKKKI